MTETYCTKDTGEYIKVYSDEERQRRSEIQIIIDEYIQYKRFLMDERSRACASIDRQIAGLETKIFEIGRLI